MTVCVIKWCHNSSEKHKKCFNITFHRIPTDPIVADKWIKNIRLSRREECWKPSPYTRICSEHFISEDKYFTPRGLCRLQRNAVPIRNLHIMCTAADSEINSNVNMASPCNELLNLNVAHHTEEILPETSNNSLLMGILSQPKLNVTQHTEEIVPEISNNSLLMGILSQPKLNATQHIEVIVPETSNNTMGMKILPQPITCCGNLQRPSEDESLYDNPIKAYLQKKLLKSKSLNIKHIKTIKTLRQKIRRLDKKNKFLKGILVDLRKKIVK